MLNNISAIVPVAKERRRIDLADSENEEKIVSRFVSTDELADFAKFLAAIDFHGSTPDFELDHQALRVSWEDWAKRIEETPSLQEMPEPVPPVVEKTDEEAGKDASEADDKDNEDDKEEE